MTLFSPCEHASDLGRIVSVRGRRGLRSSRPSALVNFMEDLSILFRYAIGRDYYDRSLVRRDV